MNYIKRASFLLLGLIKYLFILTVVIFFLTAIFLVNVYADFQSAGKNTLSGKNNLTIAVKAVQAEDWNLALAKSSQAQDEFSLALESVDASRNNYLIKHVPILETQINDLEYLIQTAEILSRSLKRSIPLVQEMQEILSGSASKDFSKLSLEKKAQFIELIYKSEPELNGLKANLELALMNLERTHRIGILLPVYSQIDDYKEQLNQAIGLMEKIAPLSKLLPALSGYPKASQFLLIFQNNDELRPSGGFIGSYGLLKVSNGEIVSLESFDSYHLDMPALGKWEKEPPAPLKKYLEVENWYLRDANWSPDWPTSAKYIEEIYNGEKMSLGEGSLDFTGIIAINPDFVADLIGLVGPIVVRNETYTANNFQRLLQYEVEVSYKEEDVSAWDRKEILNDLINELKERLFKFPSNRWRDVLQVVDSNIAEKNIQVYFQDNNLEAQVKNLGAGGEIQNPPSDYLMVVDANLGAFKSDAVMRKDIKYILNKESNSLEASVNLNYTHEGGFDWRTTRYRSYTRVYTPLGSDLIAIEGLDRGDADFSKTEDPTLNKTVFSFFWKVEPQRNNEIILSYRLPNRILEDIEKDRYSLLVQKQSGQKGTSLRVDLNFDDSGNKSWYSNLETDQYFH